MTCPRKRTSIFTGLAEPEELATLGEQLASSTKEKTPLWQGHWSRFLPTLSSQFRTGWLVNQEEATIKQPAFKFLLVSCYLSNPNLNTLLSLCAFWRAASLWLLYSPFPIPMHYPIMSNDGLLSTSDKL